MKAVLIQAFTVVFFTIRSHRAFVVKYKMGEDVDLGLHFDNAEVTLNVALSPDSGLLSTTVLCVGQD